MAVLAEPLHTVSPDLASITDILMSLKANPSSTSDKYSGPQVLPAAIGETPFRLGLGWVVN